MISTSYYETPDSKVQNALSLSQIDQALANNKGLLWIDLEKPDEDEVRQILVDTFHFHPLAIEDCLNNGYQTPKVDDFEGYLFLTLNALPHGGEHELEKTLELDIFLGSNYLVTVHNEGNLSSITEVRNRIARDDRLIRNGTDFLCHAIIDHLVDEYFPFFDYLDDEIEELEDRVLEKPEPEILARILELKHEVMFLRRLVSPLREVMNRISRDDFPMIDQKSRIYFRDVYDHLVRIQDMGESLRDIISGVLDIYLNSISLRLNNIMKALTIVSTIFLPLSFVAGVYGMNFKFMPELNWPHGYAMVWLIFILIIGAMLYFFKRQKWF